MWPTPRALQPRGLRGRWYGLAGNSNTVHLVSVQYLTKGGTLKRRVVRSRDVRFLDGATEPDDDFDAASVLPTSHSRRTTPCWRTLLTRSAAPCIAAPMLTNARPAVTPPPSCTAVTTAR